MQWLADLGQDIQVVAFFAHFFFAYGAVLTFHRHPFATAGVVVVGAAVKEFWYDARYEISPPQSLTDNLEDFCGYFLGAVVGLLAALVICK